eukprot:SAG22_NODE_548_length_9247_cov_14.468080_1_plen_205_part_10
MVTMDKDQADAAGLRGHMLNGGRKVLVPVEHTPSASGNPTHALFDDGNGGEYRKTYHGYAPPFAQLVDSPTTISGSAMQIDTWNRDKMRLPQKPGDTPAPFVPGPHPKGSFAPTEGADAIYSGLLECPLTSRVQVFPDNGAHDFGPGSKPFGQGSGYYNYTGNCTTALGPCHEWGQLLANRCPGQPRGDLLAQVGDFKALSSLVI